MLFHEIAQRKKLAIRRGGTPRFERMPMTQESAYVIEQRALPPPTRQMMPDRHS